MFLKFAGGRHLCGLCCAMLLLLAACVAPSGSAVQEVADEPDAHDEHAAAEELPALTAANLDDGELLQVVATTNIIADVVAQIGGEHLALSELIPTGADPHSFEPTPRDLVSLNQADVIFLNGLGLEESITPALDALDGDPVIISVNTGVETLEFGGESHAHADEDDHEADDLDTEAQDTEAQDPDEHQHAGADPHTWFSIHAVEQWVENVTHVLSELDPTNAAAYAENAAAYRAELEALSAELDAIVAELPVERRKLVTDHDSFGYLAAAYDFAVIGTVIPSVSTVASPSAGELAALQAQIEAEDVPAIFVGATVNPALAEQIATDIGIQVVPVYTGSLSEAGGPAGSYIDFMRYNIHTIVDALQE